MVLVSSTTQRELTGKSRDKNIYIIQVENINIFLQGRASQISHRKENGQIFSSGEIESKRIFGAHRRQAYYFLSLD